MTLRLKTHTFNQQAQKTKPIQRIAEVHLQSQRNGHHTGI
jgi:hypothetical protein